MLKPCILVLDLNLLARAKALAHRLQVDVTTTVESGKAYILLEAAGLSFVSYLTKPHLKLHLNFQKGRIAYRLQQARKEPILKAFSDTPSEGFILDATMGFAEDSVRLVTAGHRVVACEKNPFVYTLAEDAIHRAEIQNLELHNISAEIILSQLIKKPYAVYIDPMFGIVKSAKVKKEMQVLQLLADENESEEELFALALATTDKKVVVKRAIEAKPISNIKHQSVQTKTIRFDIYRK